MADVFVSYKSEDRERVRPMVAALEGARLSVWWDAQIAGGSGWRHAIQQALDAARCVIVVWSRRSVGRDGQFVHDEAVRAQKRGVYLPILIDPVDPPLGFGEVQAHSLIGWKANADDPAMVELVKAARAIVDGVPRPGGLARRPVRVDRRLVIGGGVAAAAVLGGGSFALWRGSPASAGDSIAVLPFANLSGDPAQAYFADGMAEELRAALTRIAQLKVIGRTSSELMRNADTVAAARKLGVANILTGSVRRSSATIRVNAQLIDGGNGVERWSESYDRAPGDAIAIQSGIAEAVAGELRIRLGAAERAALALGGTRNAAAHDLYLKAQAQWISDGGPESSKKSLAMLDAALALDPAYVQAHVSRSFRLARYVSYYSKSPDDWRTGFRDAEGSARTAIKLAPTFALGYFALGNVLFMQVDLSGASIHFERGYALYNGDVGSLRKYAEFLAFLGHNDRALALIKAAIARDPLDYDTMAALSWIDFVGRRYPQAIAAMEKKLASTPDDQAVKQGLVVVRYLAGQPQHVLKLCAELPPETVDCLTMKAIIASEQDRKTESDALIAKVRQLHGDTVHSNIAAVYARRGDKELAFAELDKAWAFRDPGLNWLRIDPFLDSLRGDPRFKALEAKLNYP